MSIAAPFAAIAVLLLCAAVRDLLAMRRDRKDGAQPALDPRRRSAVAALELGLPDRLARSGLEPHLSLTAVLLAKCSTAAAGVIAAWLAAPAAPGRTSLLVMLGMPLAGFIVPDALLEREARRRRRRLVGALPDALDLLAVSSASGRSPAAGFAEIAQTGSGPLVDELRMTVAELSCGRPLPDALESLRGRVPGGELATLCASIERSRRLGSPLADQLRRQSSALRRDQRRLVEERAARAAPKIQLIVALVLVPSVLLMIAAGLIANADAFLGGF
ncbi:MAG: type II secretion system F family protein [Solirubrobacterales bacterium]